MADERSGYTEERSGMSTMATIKLIIAGIALILLMTFFIQNSQQIKIEFLAWDVETRMFWALLASAVAGALAAVMVATIRGRGHRGHEG